MHKYTVGIEEEYFISHARTFAPAARIPKELTRAFLKLKYGSVTTEMMQAQVEVSTCACESFEEAREQLLGLRTMLSHTAGENGYGISASGTHPMAIWHEQTLTQKRRYRRMQDDLQIVGRRNIVCGLHVHVEVPEPQRRIPLMLRAMPYLPLLFSLSLSSPFWQGHPTGLKGYRLSAYDELPRTGFPPVFASTQSYDDFVAALVAAKIIPDASHIWWCIRPALSFPTLELRIADSTPRLDDALCIAAWFRCLTGYIERRHGSRPSDRDLRRSAGGGNIPHGGAASGDVLADGRDGADKGGIRGGGGIIAGSRCGERANPVACRDAVEQP
jgi:carboxylate-amine ligase